MTGFLLITDSLFYRIMNAPYTIVRYVKMNSVKPRTLVDLSKENLELKARIKQLELLNKELLLTIKHLSESKK